MNRTKRIGLIGVIIVCILALVFVAIRVRTPKAADNPYEMLEQIENAMGDEYKRQSITELAATLQYCNDSESTINYYILKTTYYESDPAEVAGLNTDAIKLIIDPNSTDSCMEMKIQEWEGALYSKGELSYLCWTYSPEISYILEYNHSLVADEEIIRMAESVKPINE